jgi:hypothetical protein
MFRTIPATIATACVSTKTRKIGEMIATDSRTPRRLRTVRRPSRPNVNGSDAKWSPGGSKLKSDSEHAASEIATVST